MRELVHPSSYVHPNAKLEENVEIGPFCIIHENVILKKGCKIDAYCELGVKTPLSNGSPLVIGENSIIRSHAVFYESSHFGDKLVTGHRVSVRENTFAGKNLQIGTLSDLQGDTTIGDYVRFHSNVHIGKRSTIGNFVWIFPYVVLTNDPHPPSNILRGVTVNDFAVIATMSVILPGVTIGEGALVAAHSAVKSDVEPEMVYSGSPAVKICPAGKIKLQDGTRRPAYPWNKHFFRGYPVEVIDEWNSNHE